MNAMTTQPLNRSRRTGFVVLAAAVIILTAFGAAFSLRPTWLGFASSPALASELIFYDWEEDMPQSVLDAFTQEYHVKVTYQTYESTEEAMQNIRAGQAYDLVVMESRFIPLLAGDGLLAPIDYRSVPNFKAWWCRPIWRRRR
jgi:spermidine/putrescine-binding protein